MKSNIGTADKFIRIAAAIIIALLYLGHQISGATAIFLLILAGILVLTSFIGFCPLYLPFGFSSKKEK